MDMLIIDIDPVDPSNEEAIDIRRSVRTICKKLDLEPKMVRAIQLTPRGAIVQVYKMNKLGHKYIDDVTQKIAVDTLTFKVLA